MSRLCGIGRECLLAGLAGIVLLISGCAAPPKEDRPQGVDSYVEGARLYHAGQREQATIELEKAVAINPDLRMAHIMLGDMYRAKGDYQKAAAHYEAASRLDPYTLANHYNLGVTYQFLGRLQDAAAAYLRALKLDPKDVKSNMNLGIVYLALGQVDDAVTYLERATRLDPNNASAWLNLGVALDARGSAVLAETTYRKALELDSNNIVTLQNLAQNLTSQGKAEEAVAIMQQVLKHGDNSEIHRRYGDALAAGQKFDEAIAQYDLALKADSNNLQAMNAKGFALIGKFTAGLELDDKLRLAAVDLWQKSLKSDPNQPRVAEALKKWQNPGMFGG